MLGIKDSMTSGDNMYQVRQEIDNSLGKSWYHIKVLPNGGMSSGQVITQLPSDLHVLKGNMQLTSLKQ